MQSGIYVDIIMTHYFSENMISFYIEKAMKQSLVLTTEKFREMMLLNFEKMLTNNAKKNNNIAINK